MSEEAINAINNLADAINNLVRVKLKQDPNRMLTAKDVEKETRN